MNEMELMNQQMQMSTYWNTDFFAYVWITSIIIQLIIHLLTAWWLWNINKKLWEPHAWVSWIPVINIYSIVRASGYPNIWILWLILWTISIIIPIIWLIIFLVLYFTVLNWISKRTWNWVWTTIGLFFLPFIFFPLVWYKFNPKNTQLVEKEVKKEENNNEKKNWTEL